MKFDMEQLQNSLKVFRGSWTTDHFLTYNRQRREIIEHESGHEHIWYWSTPEEFKKAAEDINALDWRYICNA